MNVYQQLGSIDPEKAIDSAYHALHVIQERTPAEQLAAAGILLSGLGSAFNIPAEDVMRFVFKIEVDAMRKAIPAFKAFQNYLEKEIRPHGWR